MMMEITERQVRPAFAMPRAFLQVVAILVAWVTWKAGSAFLSKEANGYLLGLHALIILAASVVVGCRDSPPTKGLPRRTLLLFAVGYSAWGISDACWAVNYFIESHNSKTALAVTVTMLSGLSFFSIAAAVATAIDDGPEFLDFRVMLVSLLVAGSCIGTIFLMPYAGDAARNLRTLFAATELFAIAGTCVLLTLSIAVLLSSRSLSWSIFGAGSMCWVLGDASIRIVKLLSGRIDTDAFTVLCSFGLYASMLPWTWRRPPGRLDSLDTTSLFTMFKGGSLVTIFSCLLALVLLQSHNLETIRLVALCCGVASFACIFVAWVLVERVRAASAALGTLLKRNLDDATTPIESESLPLELRDHYDLALAQSVEAQRQRQWEVGERYRVLRKVAHNILSPVAALKSQLGDIARLSEETRIIIKTAIHDISDLAGDLASAGLRQVEDVGLERVHVLSMVETALRQKRSELRGKSAVLVERRGVNGYAAFADVEEREFKAVVSNLLNNAVEAMEHHGEVAVMVELVEGEVTLRVADTGRGIPEEILAELGVEGATFGKAKGSGIGLYHAKSCAEAWGGRLMLRSELGFGTEVTVTLRAVSPPTWFVREITCSQGTTVVVLDDNPAIHKVWRQKLSPAADRAGLVLKHFNAMRDFAEWLEGCPDNARRSHLYLLDFELDTPGWDGVRLASELGIAGQAILVTSHDADSAVRRRCSEERIKLLPKAMAALLPVRRIESLPDTWDAVLIDDDASFRKVWALRAAEHDKVLAVFASAPDFLRCEASVSRDVPIYIDSSLEGDRPGEMVAKELHEELGFASVYLATAYPAADFANMPWLKGVTGKLPPWPPRREEAVNSGRWEIEREAVGVPNSG